MTSLNVLALSGSLREKSYNTALLREAARLAPAGMSIHIESIREIPLYDADVEARGFPAPVTALSDKVKSADALLIATPEYNFSVPGVLKNVIDWLSRPPLDAALARKPVAIVGAGGRLGSARAQYHLRQVCGCLSMLPVPRPEIFVLNAWEKFDAQGRLIDETVARQVGDLLVELAEWTLLLRRGHGASQPGV
jgi:chromate reductase